MRLALAQIDTTVGDLDGNRALILDRLAAAKGAGADVVVLPRARRHRVTEDLLLRPGFVRATRPSSRSRTPSTASSRSSGRRTPTAESLQRRRRMRRRRGGGAARKQLPSELRGVRRSAVLHSGNRRLTDRDRRREGRRHRLRGHVAGRRRRSSRGSAHVCSSTSRRRPSTSARTAPARGNARTRARGNNASVVFCNAVGGQDELLFDGRYVVIDEHGEVIARAPGFGAIN